MLPLTSFAVFAAGLDVFRGEKKAAAAAAAATGGRRFPSRN
jgi:hypothetical protein